MAELENVESLSTKFEEIKSVVQEMRASMIKEEDCNNQFYSILHTLDNIATSVTNLENNKTQPTDEYTILQTNILEVKKELARMNHNIDDVITGGLQEVMAKLTEKVNRLEILTNNAGIDQKVIMNITGQVEQNLSVAFKDTTETLYSQSVASTETVRKDIEEVNENMKECVDYLEKTVKVVSADAVQHLSDDMTILGTTIEKTTDNLKRSIIDIFTRIQEGVDTKAASSSGENVNPEAFDETFEMIKTGLYNLNVNTEQRISKLNKLIEEMDVFVKLQNFAKLKDLPAIGDLKRTLQSNLNRIVDEYSYTLQNSQDRNELTSVTHQFRKDVYNSILSMLGNVSEFLVEADAGVSKDAKTIDDKIDELVSSAELNSSDMAELRERFASVQDSIEKSNAKRASVSEQIAEIRNNVLEIQARGESLRNQSAEIGAVVKECAKSIVESTEPDRKSIKDLLADIKKNISILQSGDEESDYTYSMQDIESDIAKIRIYLNELTQNGIRLDSSEFTEELNGVVVMVDSMKQQLTKIDECDLSDTMSKMKDDITSISTRVNKLLLTSDNSYNVIEKSLKEFKLLSEEIDAQIKGMAGSNRFKALEDNMAAIKTTLTEANNYNSVINQSLIMLAEWVDNAGETIVSISERQGNLAKSRDIEKLTDSVKTDIVQSGEEVVAAVKELLDETNILVKGMEQTDYSELLNTIDYKLAEQSVLIEKQEERINKLDEKLSTILEFVAKNESVELASKIDDIDAKMEKLNISIAKLTSFVNEE